MGFLFFGEKGYFLTTDRKSFDRERIAAFCEDCGIALYDAAVEVIRLKNNASDDSLQVVCEVNLESLLASIPQCRAIVVTGGKAAETVCRITGCVPPAVGSSEEFWFAGRAMYLYRMPSSSRAYPRPIEWKAKFYGAMLTACGLL